MISKLLIKNFQVHKKLNLEFDSGVTTIIGSTDTGKSAIIRALRLVMTNKPSGTAFIRNESDTTEVRARIDGQTIKRLKGKTNVYLKGSEEYKAFGSNVPEAIENLCNVSLVNFQGQHDSPFWLSLSAGQVSSELNRIINLSIIDSSLSNISREVREARARTEAAESMLTDAETSYNALKWVPRMNRRYNELERQASSCATMSHQIDSNALLVSNVKSYEEDCQIAGQCISRGVRALQTGKGITTLSQRIDNLVSIIDDIEETQSQLDYEPLDLDRLTQLKSDIKNNPIQEITVLLHALTVTQDQQWNLKEKVKQAEQKLRQESKGKCPICGNQIKS